MTTRHALTIFAVSDLERQRRFYVDAFGWEPAVEVPVYVELRVPGGMRFGLYERRGFGAQAGAIPAPIPPGGVSGAELYLYPDDLESAMAAVRAAGGRELSALATRDWGEEVAYFADPEGNVLALARPLVRAAPQRPSPSQ
jgi:catechol 2,3-dioxygenase-like lactoylglutathione lyase family enzyme